MNESRPPIRYQRIIENDRDEIPVVIEQVLQHLAASDRHTEMEEFAVKVALEEALTNALFHGNLEIDSELREGHGQDFLEMYRARSVQSPYQDRRIYIDVEISHEQMVFNIRDEGPGFDTRQSGADSETSADEKPSGRGLQMMQAFMDEVNYNEAGNEITLIKKRNGSDTAF